MEHRIEINRDELDTEVIEQPERFYHAATEAAEASAVYDELKETVKQVWATVYVEMRNSMEGSGKKPTEGYLSAVTEIDPRVIEAKKALGDAMKLREQTSAVKEAFVQRGWMLKELCNMYVSGFLSTTSVKTNNKEVVTEKIINERRKAIHDARVL